MQKFGDIEYIMLFFLTKNANLLKTATETPRRPGMHTTGICPERRMNRTSSCSKTAEINIGATGNPDLQNPYAFESTRSVSHKYRSGSRSFHHHAIKVARTKLRIFPGTGSVAMHTLMSCGCHAPSLTMASISATIACLASAGPLFNI